MTSPAEIVGMEPVYSSARTPCQAGNPVKFLFRVNQMGEALNSFIPAISSLIKASPFRHEFLLMRWPRVRMVDATKHTETWYRDLALEGVWPNPRKRGWGRGSLTLRISWLRAWALELDRHGCRFWLCSLLCLWSWIPSLNCYPHLWNGDKNSINFLEFFYEGSLGKQV